MFGKLPTILTAAAMAIPLAGQAPYLHNHRPRLPHGQGPAVACLLVDLDGDGRADLVRASKTDFGIFFQDRGGRFEAANVARVDVAGTEIVSLAAGAIVTGRRPDVVVGYRDGRVLVYPNSGSSFGKPWALPKIAGSLKPAISEVLVGDLDRNGVDEIVVTLNQERPVVFRVSGVNVFKQVRLTLGPLLQEPKSVLTDLDRDGDLDLLSISGVTAAYPGLYSNTRGVLQINTTAFPIATRINASALVAANVLGKTGPELLVASLSTAAAPVRIFRNTSSTSGKPSYALHASTSLFRVARPRDMLAADANGDALPDLIAIDAKGIVVLGLNTTTAPGTFQRARTLLPAAPRSRLGAIDLEGDRDVDVFVGGAGVEDSLLLGRGAAALLNLDTEARGMPLGALNRALIGVTDVTGEGDPDLVSWDPTGRAAMMTNVLGQGRFERVANTKVPRLPSGSYLAVESAAIASTRTQDLLVLGLVSANNTTGMRTLVRRSNGLLVDETALRWRTAVKLVSMTAADVLGHAFGSVGVAGFSDVAGLDALGNIVLVVNNKGLFSRAVAVSGTRARAGSKVLVGDVNLDKLPDIVVLQPNAAVRVLLADPKNTDKFIERAGPAVPSVAGILEDVTGDLVPDLVLSVATAATKVRLFAGLGNGTFFDRTSLFMPKLGTALGVVTEIATIRSSDTPVKSVVLGFQGAADRIMRPTNRIFGAPTVLPWRGSTSTRRLIARDLDLDGDDDLLTVRFDSYPSLLLGQSSQFTHRGGVSQLGREALIHVAIPDLRTWGVLGIGPQVVRFDLPFMGVIRLSRFSVFLPMPNPPSKLVHELRLNIPKNILLFPIPMQMFTVKNGRIRFRNLDLFTPTAH